jgi:hypothetical protein
MFPNLSLPADAGVRMAHQLAAWRGEPDPPDEAPAPASPGGLLGDGGMALDLATDVAKGAAQGLIGLVSDAGKGWLMIGDMLVHGGANIHRIDAFDLRPWSYGTGAGQVAGAIGEMLSPAVAARAVQAGAVAARMLGPAVADEMMHFLVRQGLLLPVVEHMPRPGLRLFENQLPQQLSQELAAAKAVGVTPMRVGDPGFEAMAIEGTVKFVVTEAGELLCAPHTRYGVEISHAVLSGGRPVRAAGQVELFIHGEHRMASYLKEHSGHYMNGANAEQNAHVRMVAEEAFMQAGFEVMK